MLKSGIRCSQFLERLNPVLSLTFMHESCKFYENRDFEILYFKTDISPIVAVLKLTSITTPNEVSNKGARKMEIDVRHITYPCNIKKNDILYVRDDRNTQCLALQDWSHTDPTNIEVKLAGSIVTLERHTLLKC